MRVMIKLGITTVSGPVSLAIATEDMDDPVLNLLSYRNKIHVVTAAGRAFDLKQTVSKCLS